MTQISSLAAESSQQNDPPSWDNDDQVDTSFSTQDVTPFHGKDTPHYMDALVQCLGFPEGDVIPQIAKVQIDHSSNVHFGDKNIYQGPVTIRQIVYANGSASLVGDSEKTKDNLAFEKGSECGQGDEECFKEERGRNQETEHQSTGLRKGFIWLQNVSKHRPMEIGIFIAVVILFLLVLFLVLFLRHPVKKLPDGPGHLDSDNVNSEPDLIKPIDYKPDITAPSQINSKLRMISRYQWLAQPPINDTTPLITPVPYVIIHHTATTNCTSQSQCIFQVRHIQTFHIESNGWYDIGYNFLVGGDGAAYEGRGWQVEGAHTLGWNLKSIGIAFVGTFITKAPPNYQIAACQKLINQGVELGYIKPDYKLLGARQLFGTESPGTALYEKLRSWPHWSESP